MKIQSLAVIFIIIILPISLILTSYVQSQVKTLSLQVEYDAKLNNATYDALKAFQLNTINNDSSDIANSKLRDIEASVNSFFNSVSTNFNMGGYNKDILNDYVPALVYTMYDGYYIYSPFYNKLDDTPNNTVVDEDGITEELKSDTEILGENPNATYVDGKKLTGLKPYIQYSCRYKRGDDDFVITYSLDNYITIQGRINGQIVNDAGYLIDYQNTSPDGTSYRGVYIYDNEHLDEYIVDSEVENPRLYTYVKINGVKYYKDTYNGRNQWFSIMNGVRYYTDEKFKDNSVAASQYYKDAYAFTNRVMNVYLLGDLKGSNAYERTINGDEPIEQLGNYEIFDDDNIEDSNSNFNQQRLAVIRYSIEKNLSIAIANYNSYSEGVSTNFQMPRLKEDEWEKILNNISIISFLQGLNIGGKVYNGYSIITNTKNKEVVTEDSIYILSVDNQYHKPNHQNLDGNISYIGQGVFNIDFEIKSDINSLGELIYYNPKQNGGQPFLGCYSCIVTQTGTKDIEKTMSEYLLTTPGISDKLKCMYFTALGRERYSMYRSHNNLETVKEIFLAP